MCLEQGTSRQKWLLNAEFLHQPRALHQLPLVPCRSSKPANNSFSTWLVHFSMVSSWNPVIIMITNYQASQLVMTRPSCRWNDLFSRTLFQRRRFGSVHASWATVVVSNHPRLKWSDPLKRCRTSVISHVSRGCAWCSMLRFPPKKVATVAWWSCEKRTLKSCRFLGLSNLLWAQLSFLYSKGSKGHPKTNVRWRSGMVSTCFHVMADQWGAPLESSQTKNIYIYIELLYEYMSQYMSICYSQVPLRTDPSPVLLLQNQRTFWKQKPDQDAHQRANIAKTPPQHKLKWFSFFIKWREFSSFSF